MSVSRVYFEYIGQISNITNTKYRIHTVLLATSNTLYGVILLNMLCYRLRCVCFCFSSFMIVLLVLSFFTVGCILCVIINDYA